MIYCCKDKKKLMLAKKEQKTTKIVEKKMSCSVGEISCQISYGFFTVGDSFSHQLAKGLRS
jgi:hypothetical protein